MNYIHFQTIVQFRVPVDANGNAGMPEIVKKFTTAYKDSVSKKPKTKQLVLEKEDSEEVLF